jgi:hypothetical protein
MSFEQDVTQIMEEDIFKPASNKEVKQRKESGLGKEKVCINVYITEEGHDLYRVEKYNDKDEMAFEPSKNCETGYFIDSEALDQWIIDNADEIEVVRDYRMN